MELNAVDGPNLTRMSHVTPLRTLASTFDTAGLIVPIPNRLHATIPPLGN
jgi:hypothetical protein